MFFKSLFVSTLLVAALSVASTNAEGGSYKTEKTAVEDSKIISVQGRRNFCMFLPPSPGLAIAETESQAVAFCKKGVLSERELPRGFIQSAHYKEGHGAGKYVQVTGRFDRDQYELSENDGGGQYDFKSVPNSKCEGYRYFVSLVEPDVNRYCIRCCDKKKDCATHRSHLGCPAVIRGNYN
ncbi:hypothetical protein BGX28_005622 [Mortierella sp. GBA30]|nr:hypothetical protein BGX28_005622 [Mortierella sp. GBA30]